MTDIGLWETVHRRFHHTLVAYSGARIVRLIDQLSRPRRALPDGVRPPGPASLVAGRRRAPRDRRRLRRARSRGGRRRAGPPPRAYREQRADGGRARPRTRAGAQRRPRRVQPRAPERDRVGSRRSACTTTNRRRSSVSVIEKPVEAEELIRRATELQPLLAKNAAQTELDRRVVEENIEADPRGGAVQAHDPAATRRPPGDDQDQARGLGGAGGGLRLDRVGGRAHERLRVLHEPHVRPGAAGRLRRRPRRARRRRLRPQHRHRAGRRRLHGVGQVGVVVGLPARELGVRGRAAARPRRRPRRHGRGRSCR